jgi:hypothetical protein
MKQMSLSPIALPVLLLKSSLCGIEDAVSTQVQRASTDQSVAAEQRCACWSTLKSAASVAAHCPSAAESPWPVARTHIEPTPSPINKKILRSKQLSNRKRTFLFRLLHFVAVAVDVIELINCAFEADRA